VARVNDLAPFSGARLLPAASLVAVLGTLGTAAGFWLERRTTYFAYLTAFAFATSVALGGLIFLMTTYVVNAKWNIVLRRLNESISSVLLVLAVLFVPIAIGLRQLYLWMQTSPVLPERELEVLHHRQAYLNAPFFLVRTLVYFLIWGGAALAFWSWSLQRDARARAGAELAPGLAPDGGRERTFSAALIVPVSLALTFASFDWLMSLEPLWSSTMFGVYYFAGGFVGSFGLLSVLGFCARRGPGLADVIRPPHFHALGRLMLGFTIFWAYCAFFQAMLVQIANKPDEVHFYLLRIAGGFRWFTAVLALTHFALPFFVLLPRSIKFRPGAMAAVGAWILAAHYLDMLWLVLPVQGVTGPLSILWYLSALAAICGICVVFAALLLRGKSLIPVGDPELGQSIAYRSLT
jgi:hypothetical protein